MKKALFFMAMLVVLAYPTYALTTINAQSTTSCDMFGNCQTTVNLSAWLTQTKINQLKAVNLSAYLPKSIDIKSIDYKFVNNSIVIYGTIKNNTYWTMALYGTTIEIDPWWNTSYQRKQQYNITNGLAYTRTNASISFNISNAYTRADCKDITFSFSNDSTEFTQYNVTPLGSNCEIRLYDNWSVSGTNVYNLYWNCSACDKSANWKYALYEVTWLYNGANTSQFQVTEGGTGCKIVTATVDGDASVQVYRNSAGGTCFLNITDWKTQNGGNIGDAYILIVNESKRAQSGTNWANFLFLEMDYNDANSYDVTFNRADTTQLIRNRTATTYGTAYTVVTPFASPNWYYRKVNISNSNVCGEWTNSSGTYNQCHQYVNQFTGQVAGIGTYDSNSNYTLYNVTYKNMLGGTYMINRNFSITSGSEEGRTSILLWIDNAQANLTTACSAESNHNYTAQITPSGLNVSILYNGYHGATNITTVNWYASLIAGVFNITANYSGNGTYNPSSTWLQHTITLGNATPNASLMANTTPSGNNTTCANVPLNVSCGAWVLEDGVTLWSDLGGYHDVGNPYYYTPSIVGVETFKCNWTQGDCYDAGETTRQLEVIDCGILPEGFMYPINDNTVVCFTTQPVCINLKDLTLIYKGHGYYG